MGTQRIEAFSDAVIAIAITIMVLELVPPQGDSFNDLIMLNGKFFAYISSYYFIAVFWVNHHHLLATAKVINRKILLSNLVFLFFITLVPFATAWVGESSFASDPVILYGIILTLCGLSYSIVQYFIVEDLNKRVSKDFGKRLFEKENPKAYVSLAGQILGIVLAPWIPHIAFAIYPITQLIWLLPSKFLEEYNNQYSKQNK